MRLNVRKTARNCALALLLAACVGEAGETRWSEGALDDLVGAAGRAPLEGLPSEAAAISELEEMRASADVAAPEQVEFLANDLFSRLATTYARGAIDPAVADPTWHVPLAEAADLTTLRRRLAGGASPSALLASLLPASPDYAALRAELARVTAAPPNAVDTDGRGKAQRMQSLRATMERWRWLPRSMPARRIEAHIPQFEIARIEAGATTTRVAIIVGAEQSQTPSFQADIVAVTLNPYWTPPSSILLNELAPAFHRNPAAADTYEITDGEGRVVDAATVNWLARPLRHQVRQLPGPSNALGQIKFEMPNPYDIYLHDTPSRRLFEREVRALSHGCIRVQDPITLATDLLGPRAGSEEIEAAIAQGATETRTIPEPVRFVALYMTATVGDDGAVRYANDVYGRDRRVVDALDAPDVALVAQAQSNFIQCAAG